MKDLTMRLHDGPFYKILSGEKIIEIRLNDEKCQQYCVGDVLVFRRRERLDETFRARITKLSAYPTFYALFSAYPMEAFGHPSDYSVDLLTNSCFDYYSVEDEARFGVLGIHLQLCSI